MSEEVEHILAVNCLLGEGPIWNYREQALYWVNIMGNSFHRLDPRTGQHEVFEVGTPIGVLGFREKGGLVMATQKGFGFWDRQTQKLEIIADPEQDNVEMRFNDGAIDQSGRFWAGSMYFKWEVDKKEGSLYRLDPDHSVHKMEQGLAISNGIGWSPDNKTMYLTDSPRKVIYAYDFDLTTGTIKNRRPFIQSENEPGVPDGFTIDSEGCIWSCRWGAWKVIRYDPSGKVDREIKLPVEQPSKCAFGGENLDELYITSAWEGFDEEKRRQQPWAGDLFRVKPGVKGVEQPFFRG